MVVHVVELCHCEGFGDEVGTSGCLAVFLYEVFVWGLVDVTELCLSACPFICFGFLVAMMGFEAELAGGKENAQRFAVFFRKLRRQPSWWEGYGLRFVLEKGKEGMYGMGAILDQEIPMRTYAH